VVKKFTFLFLLFIFIFPCKTVAAEPNGGVYILDGGAVGNTQGGTAIIDWRDLEPVEGQYRWDIVTDPNKTFIPWLAVFNSRIKNNPALLVPRGSIASVIYPAVEHGLKVRLKLRVTEGAMPLWLYGGEDVNGKSASSYGTICGYKNYTQVYAKTPDCNKNTDVVIAMSYPLYPNKEDNAQPVWWNPVFQEKYLKTLKALSDKINSDPKLAAGIEFVEASLGSYGEMILYGKADTFTRDSDVQIQYRAAGYTNAVYSQTVQNMIDVYVRGFPNYPIAISLGTGLYSSSYDDGSGVLSVLGDVLPKVTDRYGSRVYLKFAGFPSRRVEFPRYCPLKTRCIYETFGPVTQFQGWPWNNNAASLETILTTAATDGAYILMVWTADFKVINSTGNTNLLKAYDAVLPKLLRNAAITPGSPPPTRGRGAVTLHLAKGDNTINWLTTYPAGKNYNSLPSGCFVSTKELQFWKFFRGGTGTFGIGKKYSISCNQALDWGL